MSHPHALLIFGAGSAAAIAAGAMALAAEGVSPTRWAGNAGAWLLGAVAALIMCWRGGPARPTAVILTSTVALLATFAARPVDGVHRWIDIGPLHVNVAALVLPALVVALARLEAFGARLAVVATTGAILAVQPDASQATAFALASALLLYAPDRPAASNLLALALCALIAIASWVRLDPLAPVPEVEGIFSLAAAQSSAILAVAAGGLALACVAPLFAPHRPHRGTAAVSLSAYFGVCAIAPLLGAYPVPLVGLGMSFPLGWWLGMAILICSRPSTHD